jgi:hypothetical protein
VRERAEKEQCSTFSNESEFCIFTVSKTAFLKMAWIAAFVTLFTDEMKLKVCLDEL